MSEDRKGERRRRLGTPKPEWGDNVIEADFGSRGRRAADQDATDGPDLTRGFFDPDSRLGRAVAERRAVQTAAEEAEKRRTRQTRQREQRAASTTEGWAGSVILDTVCAGADTARRQRGLAYAREGKVRNLDLELGTASALVTGSQLEPFEVSLRWCPLSENQVTYIHGECLEHPENLSRLLAGRKPRREVVAVLLSPSDFRDSWCTCPDRAGMCKHRIAVAHAVAEQFTTDPVAFLDWRGMDTRTLIEEVGEKERQRHPQVVDLQRRAVQTESSGSSCSSGSSGEVRREPEDVRYSAGEFWGDLSRLPEWEPMDVRHGLELGDRDTRNAVIRKVSWNTVDQLRVLDELESCYRLLTGEDKEEYDTVFDREPWLSDPSGRIGEHD
jgi:uncharacterized Zn finger protein